MKNHEQLKNQLFELHTLARIQRGLRLGLRALWLGVGGIILGWGINAIWGVLPNRMAWYAIGLAFAAFPIVGILKALHPRSRWVWLLDRRLGLHEQVSTAWEVVEKGQTGGLSDLLVRDVTMILNRVRDRMLQRGWYLQIDLVSALIVGLLAAVLLGSGLIRPFSDLIGQGPAAFDPPPPPLPSLQQPFPEEQPPPGAPEPGGEEQPGGEAPGSQPEPGQQPGDQPGQQPAPGESSSADGGQLGDILRELGSDLSRQAGTYDLGQALENMDLNGAAEALDDLKEQLDELSPESRDNLAQALEDAAEALQEAGESGLAGEMSDAAESLQQGNEQAGEDLGQMADQLRELAQQMGESGVAGSGSGSGGSGGTGNPEPLSRLPGEGGEMDLPLTDPSQSGLLSPSNADEAGEGVAEGSQDSTYQPGTDALQSPLYPSSYLWKWRDVVSQYFQR